LREKNSGSTSLPRERRNESSFIRTVTVGSSIALDLLTSVSLAETRSARGLAAFAAYRRWGISPRPEDDSTIGQRAKSCSAPRRSNAY